ncbi:hypothetical protein ACS0TY_035840 [Phlomoides rotata]
MQAPALPESITFSGKLTAFGPEYWSDDAFILETDYFIKTLSKIQAKGTVKPDLIGSIITHYASKWLLDLAGDEEERATTSLRRSPESLTSSWMKKKLFIETLIGILPRERDSLSCDFLLRILRAANMVGVEASCRSDLEKRISSQLDQASLKELMIPCFSHTCTTLFDFDLVLRLVTMFVNSEEVSRSGSALMKVARLVDSYLAETAVDSQLTLSEFVALVSALPCHARATDDGLYRAIDTYLKAHPGLSKQERKRVCMLMDSRKLSKEASLHAAQNERLPVRAVIQVVLSEQNKLSKQIDWSGSLSSPLDITSRCLSKREVSTQQMEIKRLKEDVLRLQSQCMNMEMQIENLSSSSEKKKGFFKWKKLGISVLKKANKIGEVEVEVEGGEASVGLKTPIEMKARSGRPIGGISCNKWNESFY